MADELAGTKPSPDEMLEGMWDLWASLPSAVQVTLTIGGHVVTGTPIGPVEYLRRHGEEFARMVHEEGFPEEASRLRQITADGARQLDQLLKPQRQAGVIHATTHVHLADVRIYTAAGTELEFPSWRCSIAHVSGWTMSAVARGPGQG